MPPGRIPRRKRRSSSSDEDLSRMKWILAPGMAFFIRLPNRIKLPLLAGLYTVPLAIALLAQPFAISITAGYRHLRLRLVLRRGPLLRRRSGDRAHRPAPERTRPRQPLSLEDARSAGRRPVASLARSATPTSLRELVMQARATPPPRASPLTRLPSATGTSAAHRGPGRRARRPPPPWSNYRPRSSATPRAGPRAGRPTTGGGTQGAQIAPRTSTMGSIEGS